MLGEMMLNEQYQIFQRLTEAPGAPGFEAPVRDVMRELIQPYSDEIITDNLGSIFGVKKSNESDPRVMVAGHLDEVGFMVTMITKDGFIRFQPLGGWWSQVLLAQRLVIQTDNGPVYGVIGSTPPHNLSPEARNKPMELKHMYVDVGALSKEEAESFGIKPGQPIVPVCPFTVLKNEKMLMAKAWDNRYGCSAAAHLLRNVHNEKLSVNLYSGATVQEEVGLRGAATAANLIQPDLFFAVDASPANDTPGISEGFGKLGNGALVRIFDRGMITHRGLRDFILDTAESEKIPYQFYISAGGQTDAARVHTTGNGVPSAVIGICSRYIHSHAAIINYDDYENAVRLLTTIIKKLDRSTIESIKQR